MTEHRLKDISLTIKTRALALGFDACGIAQAIPLEQEKAHLQEWLNKGMNAGMLYMQRNIDKRLNPRLLVPNAKSVICLLMNYKPDIQQNPNSPKIARYAYGNDYHEIIWEKLNHLLEFIKQLIPDTQGRGFTDSAPILERAWAVRAGLGWIGKNSTLISPVYGSFTFLAELIVDSELEYDKPYMTNGCGACNRCMANCPTGAICTPKTVDAHKCISYQTIENKSDTTVNTQGWLFGCDICLKVCPWNKRTPTHNHKELKPIPQVLNMSLEEWNNLSEQEFNVIFKYSPIKRIKYAGLKRNLRSL